MVSNDAGVRETLVDQGNPVADDQWHAFVLVYDRSVGQATVHTEVASGDPVTLSGDCSSSRPMTIGADRLRSAACEIGFVGVASGTQVEGLDARALASALRQRFVS